MRQNANALMEPSPLIAALSQAFVKCSYFLLFWTRCAAVFLFLSCSAPRLLSPARGQDKCLNETVLAPSQGDLSLPGTIGRFARALS